jgi:hypothetical protein
VSKIAEAILPFYFRKFVIYFTKARFCHFFPYLTGYIRVKGGDSMVFPWHQQGICSLLIAGALAAMTLVGCSNDDDNNGTGPSTEPVIVTVTLGTNSMEVNLRDLPSFNVEDLAACSLNTLISPDLVAPWLDHDSVAWDMRPLHGYRMVGSDGFNPHDNRGYIDCYWDWLGLGYVFVESRDVIFPDELIDLPGAYNVHDTAEILAFRMMKVVTPFDSFLVEFDDITPVQVQNPDSVMEDALPLVDFVPDTIVTLGADNFHYKIVAVDGFTQNTPLTWEQLQIGYWLLDTEKTWFLSDTLHSGQYKIQAAAVMEIIQ